MGRSNNQRRRTAKALGQAFIPAWTKSKTKQLANRQKIEARSGKVGKKLAYGKMVTKHGKLASRKFRGGGYNNSGKLGNARTTAKAKQKQSRRNQ